MNALTWLIGSGYVAVYMVVAVTARFRLEDRTPSRMNLIAGPCVALFWPLWLPAWVVWRNLRPARSRHAAGRHRAERAASEREVRSC